MSNNRFCKPMSKIEKINYTGSFCSRLYADPVMIHNCKAKILNMRDKIKALSDLYRLAGNEVRFKILFLIQSENRLCVCDLSDILEMKIPAVSQHLRKLKDGGILETTREGQTIYYSMNSTVAGFFQPHFVSLNQESFKDMLV